MRIPMHSHVQRSLTLLGQRVRLVRAPTWGLAGLFLLFAFLYIVTATRDYTFDAVSYALQIERFGTTGEWRWIFHPHHLLFNGAGLAFHAVLRAVGFGSDPLGALQAMNAFTGAAGVILFAAVVGRLCGDRSAGMLAGAGLGLSYGYWTCATDGRVNLAGLVVLIAALPLVVALLRPERFRRPEGYLLVAGALGAMNGLAALLHQSHALFAAAGLLAIHLSPGSQRRPALAAYLGAMGALLGMAYGAAAYLAAGAIGPAAILRWALTYAHEGRWWSLDVLHNLAADVRAFWHALIANPALSGQAGTRAYLPGVLLLGAGFLIAALWLWWEGQRPADPGQDTERRRRRRGRRRGDALRPRAYSLTDEPPAPTGLQRLLASLGDGCRRLAGRLAQTCASVRRGRPLSRPASTDGRRQRADPTIPTSVPNGPPLGRLARAWRLGVGAARKSGDAWERRGGAARGTGPQRQAGPPSVGSEIIGLRGEPPVRGLAGRVRALAAVWRSAEARRSAAHRAVAASRRFLATLAHLPGIGTIRNLLRSGTASGSVHRFVRGSGPPPPPPPGGWGGRTPARTSETGH